MLYNPLIAARASNGGAISIIVKLAFVTGCDVALESWDASEGPRSARCQVDDAVAFAEAAFELDDGGFVLVDDDV